PRRGRRWRRTRAPKNHEARCSSICSEARVEPVEDAEHVGADMDEMVDALVALALPLGLASEQDGSRARALERARQARERLVVASVGASDERDARARRTEGRRDVLVGREADGRHALEAAGGEEVLGPR